MTTDRFIVPQIIDDTLRRCNLVHGGDKSKKQYNLWAINLSILTEHSKREGIMNNSLVRPAPASTSSLYAPPPINSVEDTGLSALWLQDLALKILYAQGYMSGFKIAALMALPFAGVTDGILEALKREKMLEVKSSQGGLGEGAYSYGITGAGIARS